MKGDDSAPSLMAIITRLTLGGPSRLVLAVHEELLRRGRRSWVVYGTAAAGEEELAPPTGEGIIRLPELGREMRPLRDVACALSVRKILAHLRPDVVMTHTAKAGAAGRVGALIHHAGGLLRRQHPARVYHVFHGNVFSRYFGPTKSALFRWSERLLATRPFCAGIFALSPQQRWEIAERFNIAPADRCRVLPLGMPPLSANGGGSIREEQGIPATAPVFLAVGRIAPIKNYRLMIEAFARLVAVPAGEAAHLVIVGGGPTEQMDELRQQARAAGIGERVHLTGYCHDVYRYYAAADHYVLSSDNEGTPLSILEAFSAGLPVVATDVGGVADIVVSTWGPRGRPFPDPRGIVVPPRDALALSAAFSSLVLNPGLRRALGAAGRRYYEENFTFGAFMDDLLAVLDRPA